MHKPYRYHADDQRRADAAEARRNAAAALQRALDRRDNGAPEDQG
ncbi:hypothetical protein [Phaeacidiphilus oryzae]|jgi:hypothetical protein|nr:hypothetical protein [Phaeacidiphilus oryzae]